MIPWLATSSKIIESVLDEIPPDDLKEVVVSMRVNESISLVSRQSE